MYLKYSKNKGFIFTTFNQINYILYFSNCVNSILSSLLILKELDTKKRKLRSIHGLLLYALEMIQDEKTNNSYKNQFSTSFLE